MATGFGSVDVVVRFVSDTSKLSSDMDKVSGTGNKLKSGLKTVGLAVAGAFAVKEVSDWVGAAEEANSVSAGLAKTLQNAGDATGDWAKHAEDLSGALMKKTGIDDEVIKGGQTILATFHDVSGAVGQQSGIFDRASAAALDMSKAGFGSVDSAATMLGKALQDPEKGLTALGKAGITFSDDQKNAIKAMLDSGDKAGAMAAIMQNVEGQVGGVAESTATAGDKMKTAFGETQESLGNALLPILEAVLPIIQKIAEWIQQNSGWAVVILGFAAAMWVLNAALAANPVVLIVIGIAALIAALVLLWLNWETVWNWITNLIGIAVGWILDHWQLIIGAIFPIIGAILLLWNNWDTIWNWIMNLIGTVVGWIGDQIGRLLGFFAGIPSAIGSALAGLGEIIKAPFQWAWDQIVTIKDGIVEAFTGAIGIVKDAWNAFARFWNGIEVEVPGVTMPGPIPNIPGFTFGLPDLPQFAKGGIVTRPTLGLLGEAGPEAIVPLGQLGAGNVTIVVNAGGLGADSPQIQSAVVAALDQYTTRNGRLPARMVGA
jgi:hypothetical protein